jgi:hypothetical protein
MKAVGAGVGIEDPRLVDELNRCGLAVPVSAGLVRIRGLDRYKRAWEKNQRRKPALVVPVTGANPAPLSPVPARKTETETETEKKETTLSSKLDPPPASFLIVFEYWRRVMSYPKAKAVDKRRKAVAGRLAEGYTIEQLKQAIDGCAKTPHNMGQNAQGKRFDDLELICRNGIQVERFMRNAESGERRIPVRTVASGENLYPDFEVTYAKPA